MLVNHLDFAKVVGTNAKACGIINNFLKIAEIEVKYIQMEVPSRTRHGECTRISQVRHVNICEVIDYYTDRLTKPAFAHNFKRYAVALKYCKSVRDIKAKNNLSKLKVK